MTLADIKRHISKKLDENYTVYTENVDKMTRPFIFVSLIDYIPTMNTAYRQQKKATIDIRYYGKGDTVEELVNYQDIYENLEIIDNIFESNGLKIIKVLDRTLHLKDQNTKIVDKVGHYMFDLDFYDDYGTRPVLPLMAELQVTYES